MHKLSHTPPTFSTSMEHGGFKRPRSGSISSRLRSASDLCDEGVLNQRQKGVLKDLIISGDAEVENAIQRHRTGDPSAVRDLNRLSRVERKSSLDLLGSYGDLDLNFLNVGGMSNPGTPALGALTPKWGPGEVFAMDVEGGFEFTIDEDGSDLVNIPLVHVARDELSSVGGEGRRSRKHSFALSDELDFATLLEGGMSTPGGMRLHRDSISAMEEFHLDDLSTPRTGPASFGVGFATSAGNGFGLNAAGPDGRIRSFSKGRAGSFSIALPPPAAPSGTTKKKTKAGASRSKATSKTKKGSASVQRKRSPASARSKPKTKAKSSPIGIPTGRAKGKGGSSAAKPKVKSIVLDTPKAVGDDEYDTGERPLGAPPGNVGAYSPESRKTRIAKFLDKRQHRIWKKRVKYDVRKNFADSRLRVKGRFVKKEDEELLRDLMNMI